MIMTIVRENLICNREYVTNASKIQIIKAQPVLNDRFEGIDISVPREGEEGIYNAQSQSRKVIYIAIPSSSRKEEAEDGEVRQRRKDAPAPSDSHAYHR
jgi:hypothetical protein